MNTDFWKYDRGDIRCSNCGYACYFKYMGEVFGEKKWVCACCGWRYREHTPPTLTRMQEIRSSNNSYFIFGILPVELALLHHPLAEKHDEKFLRASYMSWIQHYQDIVKSFYLGQENTHTERTFNAFSRKYEVGHGFSQEGFWAIRDMGLMQQWKNFKKEEALDEHKKAHEAALIELRDYVRQFDNERLSYTPNVDSVERYKIYQSHENLFYGFNSVWFNHIVVSNSPEEQLLLKNISNSDYQKTSHWQKIRSAILMVNDGRCEACWAKWVSLPKGESDLHIHHQTYKNLGNERFDDLMLVCTNCHEKIHATES